MSKTKRIFVTVFGGWFGLHKYMDGKIMLGILYTLTLGIFCIGWIYDCIKAFTSPNIHVKKLNKADLLNWQNIVMHDASHKRLVASYGQLLSFSEIYVENQAKILTDSINLVHNTTNPEVFFSRLDIMVDCYNNLVNLEEFYYTGLSPSEKLQHLNEDLLIHNFIQRYWYNTVCESQKLKTEKAKENRLTKAKNTLLSYSERMDTTNIQYIHDLT